MGPPVHGTRARVGADRTLPGQLVGEPGREPVQGCRPAGEQDVGESALRDDAPLTGGGVPFHDDQLQTAANELPTDNYTLLNAEMSVALDAQNLFLFLRGGNLTDEEARQHTSPLKDTFPMPGRSLKLGLRYEF